MTPQQSGSPPGANLLLLLGPFVGIYAARRTQGRASFKELGTWAILGGAAAGSLLLDLLSLATLLASGTQVAVALAQWIGHGLGGALFIGGPAAVIAAHSRRSQLGPPSSPPVDASVSGRFHSTISRLRVDRWRPFLWSSLMVGTTIGVSFGGDVRVFGPSAVVNGIAGVVLGALAGVVVHALVIFVPIVVAPVVTVTVRVTLSALLLVAVVGAVLWLGSQSLFWILVGAIVVGGTLLALILAALFRRTRGGAA